ncbi:MAG: tRNA (adenosine(37)-N6)-threonylcarbamoyltransferase complex ATPase subunit type 1 TsaE [Bacteroidetes bacterium]|nr:tRNA (adenosine(37)-N6)-threonylcarbamoyltransferase complex ATPase subunit type 1 TsaE [Bacteroidota bacterium]
MSTLKIDISRIEQHQEAVKQLMAFAGNERIFLFEAPMGAGKTTFIKSICAYLQVSDTMSSPTYSIVNEYHTKTQNPLFHFDLYRLRSSEELFELGFEDYVASGNYLFIEWPELALPFLDTYLRIIISKENNNRYLYAEIIRPL